MERLIAEELLSLQYGDTVYFRTGSYTDAFRYVGRMPSSERYLIFSCGEKLKHLYISEKDNSFRGEWYRGEFDDKYIIQIRINELEKELENLKEEMKR
ncbi:hypothetical protein UFOVP104_17 [uncultured Caudovirales phage]|uniref:Uncharacterized protein n=1 Tax=uncultured Caudovirales phage TaxID=2100421 RepID=A0A6J5LID3_9CAUD|nr:hypothetical protein UFOVP104_17 [uncultured Caudovirales phage]CAB4134378.1 hypothetical protein UFOVP271_52 [uncultured Caudovirales phage]